MIKLNTIRTEGNLTETRILPYLFRQMVQATASKYCLLTPPKTVVMILNMLLPAFPRLPLAVQSGSLGGDALKRFEKSQAGPPRKLRDCIGLLGSRGVNMSQDVTGHRACKVVQSEVCHASSIVMPLTRGSRDFGKASPNPHRGHHQWERPWIE